MPASPSGRASRPSPWVFVKLGLTAFFWGGTFIAGRIAAQAVPLMLAATGRFAVAVLLLLLAAWKFEGGLPRLDRSQILATAALGFTGIFLYNLCFLGALTHIPAGRAALFISLNPIVIALAAALLLRERLAARRWLGIGLAFVGAAVIITRGDPLGAIGNLGDSFGLGEGLMFGAISSWAAYTLIGRLALKSLSPIAATTYAALWGLAFLALGAIPDLLVVDGSRFTWQVWASLIYLGAFGTVIAFIWYYEGVKILGPSRTAVFNNLVPVFGVILAMIVLGEPVLISMVVGGALVIAGVSLTNR